jgi:hypothetical protein
MGRYWLADHVFLCIDDAFLVVLDLRQDRYWQLEASSTAPLSGLVPGWPVRPLDAPLAGSSDPEMAQQIAEALIEQGILTESETGGKDATPVRVAAPRRELLSADEYKAARGGMGALGNLISAAVSAKVALRLGRFEKAVQRVQERKRNAGCRTAQLDFERARTLVEQFFRLRVFLFTSKSECLFDSLTLLNFLARYGIFPDWVFGVQARPFAAHCWVQLDEIVFNDTVEHVRGYTPIMAV